MSQQLKQENKKLKELTMSCEEELQKLREVGRAHQNQIDTLLKFNQRLLGIIENQFNSAAKSRLSSQLHPITQANEAAPQLAAGDKLKNKLPTPPPRIGGGLAFQQQDLQGFLDDDEEEIYNQQRKTETILQKMQSAPTQSKPQTMQKNEAIQLDIGGKIQIEKKQVTKQSKLERVYEMQHNKEQWISINLSNSMKNSNQIEKQRVQYNKDKSQLELQIYQLRDTIKEYKQQFVDNSSEYEQICQIIHKDLIKDTQQFKKAVFETRQNYQELFNEVQNLKNQIKRFKPTNQLERVMKKLNVPPSTQRILYERIISRAH